MLVEHRPGEPQDDPAVEDEGVLPPAVVLEDVGVVLVETPVDLDHDARPRGTRRRGSSSDRRPAPGGSGTSPRSRPRGAAGGRAVPPRTTARPGSRAGRAAAAGCPGVRDVSSRALHSSAERGRPGAKDLVDRRPCPGRTGRAQSAPAWSSGARAARGRARPGIVRVSRRKPGVGAAAADRRAHPGHPHRRPERQARRSGTGEHPVRRPRRSARATFTRKSWSGPSVRRRRAGRRRARRSSPSRPRSPRRSGCARRATTPSRRTIARTSSCSFDTGPASPTTSAQRPVRRAVHRGSADGQHRAASARGQRPSR